VTSLEATIARWDGEAVVTRRDAEAQAWIFMALHDSTLGPAAGGTRMRAYPDAAAALEDAMRLAEGMTEKWAILGLPYGGGKTVIAPDRPLTGAAREAFLLRYGRLLETLHGGFQTGEDLGTTPADMGVVARASKYVHGIGADGATLDPGPFTARGVLRSIEAALEANGDGALRGRSVLVQGVGDVGAPLARLLAEAGARVLVCDLDEARGGALADEIGADRVPVDAALAAPCDVFAPCAIGAVLNRETIPRLACRAVCGSANNQLERPEDADLLHQRGILYAPDYIANSGGAIAFALMARKAPAEEIERRIEGIGAVLDQDFAEAAREGRSPLSIARRRVERMLGREEAA